MGMEVSLGQFYRFRTYTQLIIFFLFSCLLATCNPSITPSTSLTIAAASSLTDAFSEIATAFEEQSPNVNINFNFAASGLLEKQIAQGAPIDLFASAADAPMDALAQQGHIVPATRTTFAQNQLVVIVPVQDSNKIEPLKDLKDLQVQRLAIGNPATVPAGSYAKEALESERLYTRLQQENKLVFAENVRQVLTYVEQGNVDAGIVYATDAAIGNNIGVALKLSPGLITPIRYPIAVTSESLHPELAKAFISFVIRPESQNILQKYGFVTVEQ